MSRARVGCLMIFTTLVTSVHAQDNGSCGAKDWVGNAPATRIAAWRAGVVTAGSSIELRLTSDGSDSACGGISCFAQGGVSGVELCRVGRSVLVEVPWKGKLWTRSGWIPATRWHTTDSSPRPVARWVGVWQNESAKITVQSVSDGQLELKAHAVRGLYADVEIYGDFSISGKPANGILTSKDGSGPCEVSVRLLGDYIAAVDNNACGGEGVTFTGMYRLRHR